jgi:NADH-quinone oxidoreductase subunit J
VLEGILFYLFAGVAIGGALAVVSFRNPIYSALSLLLTLFSIAALFLLMQATFVAVVHIAVYAGAIIILFLFVIMLMGVKKDEVDDVSPAYKWATLFAGLCLAFVLAKAIMIIFRNSIPATNSLIGDAQALGSLIFSKYLLPFELISLLILVAVIGAVYLGGKRQ